MKMKRRMHLIKVYLTKTNLENDEFAIDFKWSDDVQEEDEEGIAKANLI